MKKTKEEIINKLLKNCTDKLMKNPIYHTVNNEKWTIADLFIRQWLNNGCDGFDMVNVLETYDWLVTIKEELIKFNLVSENGRNNSGFPLWENYDF